MIWTESATSPPIHERLVRNWSARPAGAPIDALIVHDTEGSTAESAIAWFDDPASQASAHFVLDRDGTVYRCVPEAAKAWHAGRSNLWGRPDLNETSLGLELVGHATEPYPDAQLGALLGLTVDLCLAFPAIALNRVVGHEHIAPGRKGDPGPFFPWRAYLIALGRELAGRGVLD